ncbi:hypothetical protein OJF2_79240 (plasmid) [Aquisphaera giovannonii]|uniref:Uncharacterized protein n=1 Tax=Aquisphaera giovannonii TaxID=406548 RepID=A0A5B9WGB9_9BACT|nr:hypothetical protein [Aquisphaera giovannonii]QEH39309.1 hypothetical protein OJF2_79240 [Aquisphaera giovannonii]
MTIEDIAAAWGAGDDGDHTRERDDRGDEAPVPELDDEPEGDAATSKSLPVVHRTRRPVGSVVVEGFSAVGDDTPTVDVACLTRDGGRIPFPTWEAALAWAYDRLTEEHAVALERAILDRIDGLKAEGLVEELAHRLGAVLDAFDASKDLSV